MGNGEEASVDEGETAVMAFRVEERAQIGRGLLERRRTIWESSGWRKGEKKMGKGGRGNKKGEGRKWEVGGVGGYIRERE